MTDLLERALAVVAAARECRLLFREDHRMYGLHEALAAFDAPQEGTGANLSASQSVPASEVEPDAGDATDAPFNAVGEYPPLVCTTGGVHLPHQGRCVRCAATTEEKRNA